MYLKKPSYYISFLVHNNCNRKLLEFIYMSFLLVIVIPNRNKEKCGYFICWFEERVQPRSKLAVRAAQSLSRVYFPLCYLPLPSSKSSPVFIKGVLAICKARRNRYRDLWFLFNKYTLSMKIAVVAYTLCVFCESVIHVLRWPHDRCTIK